MPTEERHLAGTEVRRRRRRWWLPLLLWLMVAGWVALHVGTLRHLLMGPTPLHVAALAGDADLSPLEGAYLLAPAADLEMLGPYSYSQGKKPYLSYGLLRTGNKRLLVLRTTDDQGRHFAGILEPLSPYERQHVVPRLREHEPKGDILPYRLNTSRPLLPISFLMTLVPICCLAGAALWLTAGRLLSRSQSRW